MDSFLLVTPHPSPSIVAPPTSAPPLQLQLVNLPAWLEDSDVPTFIPSTSSVSGSKRRHDVPLPPTPDTFFLTTPLELIRHEATRRGVNVVSPPPTPPRFHLRICGPPERMAFSSYYYYVAEAGGWSPIDLQEVVNQARALATKKQGLSTQKTSFQALTELPFLAPWGRRVVVLFARLDVVLVLCQHDHQALATR